MSPAPAPSSSSSSVFDPLEPINDILAPLTPLGIQLVAAFSFFVGLMLLIAGKKMLKMCMFCIGFGVGFILFAAVADKLNVSIAALNMAPQTLLSIGIAGGVLIGSLSAFLVTVTKVIIAIGVAVGLAFISQTMGLSADASIDHNYILWILLLIVFFITLWLAFKIFDQAVVVGTTLLGSLCIVVSVAQFIPSLDVSLWAMFKDPSSVQGCSQQDAWNGCNELLLTWAVLVLMGFYVQCGGHGLGCGNQGNHKERKNKIENEMAYTQI
jgi:hypothetical protein